MAVVGIDAEAEAGREHHLGARGLTHVNAQTVLVGIGVEVGVGSGLVHQERHIYANTVSKLQVAAVVILVLHIEAELGCLSLGSIAEVATAECGIGTAEVECAGLVVEECVE